MADELNDILASGHEDISNEDLLKYLKGELSPDQRHRMEMAMIDSEMLNDAVEGLQTLQNSSRLDVIQNEIETRLKKNLQSRKEKREKRKIRGLYWMLFFITILLLLILAGFAVIYLARR